MTLCCHCSGGTYSIARSLLQPRQVGMPVLTRICTLFQVHTLCLLLFHTCASVAVHLVKTYVFMRLGLGRLGLVWLKT